ncbi:MAG: tetratricopeptide repeat protein [Anaerolineae bacterium]|nr:tetratricopeptide repeat protein [Anaerolineae bacterium]
MYNAPPPNLMRGIQLVQAQRKDEALAYLRHAARHEPINADGWLWLAAATDDYEEYRHCVNQALTIDPQHPVARRMREQLDRQAYWARGGSVPAAVPPQARYAADVPYAEPVPALQDTAAQHRPSRLRRVLRVLTLVIVLSGIGVGIGVLAMSGFVQDTLEDWLTDGDTHTLTFTVGADPGFRFTVDVPSSWLPADTDSPSWRDTRDDLLAQFPTVQGQIGVWEQADESFSSAVRDPVYGAVLPNVRLIETDPAAVKRDGMLAVLTLQEIVPLPDLPEGETGTTCDRMRLLEQRFADNGSLTAMRDVELLEAALARRDVFDDCVYTIHRRYTNQLPHQVTFPLSPEQAPTATRSVMLAVPVQGERYAVWFMTFADSAYDDYENTVNGVIGSLVFDAED